MGDVYRTGIEILVGFGPVGNTGKKIGADYEQLLRPAFSSFRGQKKSKTCRNVSKHVETCLNMSKHV